jgi:NTE family protein
VGKLVALPRWASALRIAFGRAGSVFFQQQPTRIGLALGGGFARGIAHIGVLRAFERHGIPIHCISGVSAGSMVAAAYAGGADTAFIEEIARGMRFRDVARWTLNRMGLAGSDRMAQFLHRLLKERRFERMKIPLAVVATDLVNGAPVVFRDEGDAVLAIRASCSYPGLFQPVRVNGHCLVDGYVVCDVPVAPLRQMGATHVIAVHLPSPAGGVDPANMFAVVNRCFQVMGRRLEQEWRSGADLVIEPKVEDVGWDSFTSTSDLIRLGEAAAEGALGRIQGWLTLKPLRRTA